MERLVQNLRARDYPSAVCLLLFLLQKNNKRELARRLHPDKHPGDPFFVECMKALNRAADLAAELGPEGVKAHIDEFKRAANVRNNSTP